MFRFAPSLRSSPAWLRDWAGAWVFYSVLPPWPWIQPRFERIARFAPLVGVVLGGLQALFWILTSGWMPLMAQVPLVLALAVLLSGGLHLDGAMDTADGLAAGPRALEAMDDSRVGAAGVQALILLLLLRAAALVCLAGAAPAALVWAAFWGRVSPLVALEAFPYLRPGGTASFHREHWQGLRRELVPALVGLGLLLAGTLVWGGTLRSLVGAGLVGLVPAVLVPVWLGRRFGGHSGDTYGACVEWSDAVALLLMGLLVQAAR